MNKVIGIIGCGWLGLPLAISLAEEQYTVHGSTTSEEKVTHLIEKGIIPFIISLGEDNIAGDITSFLSQIDVLVINVPPKLRGKGPKENYVKKMQVLHQKINSAAVDKVIFISSTSVYGNIDGDVTENTTPQPSTESGKQMLASENIFINDTAIQTTIIRFGGLIGPKRQPITMLSGRQNLSNGKAPINLIHLNDCINIIKSTIHQNWWGLIINGVYPYHPSKEEYYTQKAIEFNLPAPNYNKADFKKGKKVKSQVLLDVKKYQFLTTV